MIFPTNKLGSLALYLVDFWLRWGSNFHRGFCIKLLTGTTSYISKSVLEKWFGDRKDMTSKVVIYFIVRWLYPWDENFCDLALRSELKGKQNKDDIKKKQAANCIKLTKENK